MRRATNWLIRTCLVLALIGAFPSNAAPHIYPVGTDATKVGLSVSGATKFGDGWAIPLKGSQPNWYTPSLAEQVSRGHVPVAAPADAPLPSEVGIRPGAWMIAPYGCTMNFIFTDNRGRLGIGTAGHCTDHIGQRVTLLTLAPGTGDPVLVDIGHVIARHNSGIGDDFALVEIKPSLHSWVSPTMAAVGGPCGGYPASAPDTATHYGHGLIVGAGGTFRAGPALTWKTDAFGFDSASIFGDSGSPVRVTSFAAAGNLTHLVYDSSWLPSVVAGTRIYKMAKIASGWSLVSSPLCL